MEMGKRRGNISLWRPSVCPAVVWDRLYCPWDGRPLAPQLLLGVTGAQKAQPLRRRSLNMVGLLRAPSSGKVLGEGGFRGGGGDRHSVPTWETGSVGPAPCGHGGRIKPPRRGASRLRGAAGSSRAGKRRLCEEGGRPQPPPSAGGPRGGKRQKRLSPVEPLPASHH